MKKLLILMIITILMISCSDEELVNQVTDSNLNDNELETSTILDDNNLSDEGNAEDHFEETKEVINTIDDITYIELKEEMVVNNRLRVRKGPSVEYDYLTIDYYVKEDNVEEFAYLLIGSRVTVNNRTSELHSVGEDKHYWYEITYTSESNKEIQGWVYGLYLTPFIEESAEIYIQKLSFDKIKYLLSEQIENEGLDVSKDVNLYWHHEEYNYMVLVLADESSDLVSTAKNFEVYLLFQVRIFGSFSFCVDFAFNKAEIVHFNFQL